MAVEEFRRIYRSHLEDFLSRLYVPDRLHRRIDEIAAVIREPIAAQSAFRLDKFEQAVGWKPVHPSPGEWSNPSTVQPMSSSASSTNAPNPCAGNWTESQGDDFEISQRRVIRPKADVVTVEMKSPEKYCDARTNRRVIVTVMRSMGLNMTTPRFSRGLKKNQK
jgi:hypothetical protein